MTSKCVLGRACSPGGALAVIAIAVLSVGCTQNKPLPHLTPPVAMTAVLQPAPEWGVKSPKAIAVRREDLTAVFDLIKPTRAIHGSIDKSTHLLAAMITTTQQDGSHVTIYVRCIGKNPAAVSLDDKDYFWADDHNVPDGVIELIRILTEKH